MKYIICDDFGPVDGMEAFDTIEEAEFERMGVAITRSRGGSEELFLEIEDELYIEDRPESEEDFQHDLVMWDSGDWDEQYIYIRR